MGGIINGDKNGLFVVDSTYNFAPDTRPGHEGALIPVAQPHGQVQEVTAPNVEPDDVLFSKTAIAEMDAACGPQQSLSAIRMSKGGLKADNDQVQSWKKVLRGPRNPSAAAKEQPKRLHRGD